MQILEQVEIKIDWPDINNLHNHPMIVNKRSKGLHVTDILRKIAIKNKILIERDIEEEFAPIRVLLGMGFEYICVKLYKDIIWQPGELTKDGIIGSPDGYSRINSAIIGAVKNEFVLDEFKFTAKSLREKGGDKDSIRDITKDWLWRNQVLCYLAMHPDKPSLVRWHICYARGNYDWADILMERYVRYLVRFSEAEILGAWNMIKKYKYL
jgi:hypothetical protein